VKPQHATDAGDKPSTHQECQFGRKGNFMTRLSDALSLGGVSLRNPIIMAPVKTAYGVSEGKVTDRHIAFYKRRGADAGAITPEPFYIHYDLREIPIQIGAHNDDMIPGLKRLADTIHAGGARAIAHISHPGRMANPNIETNKHVSSSEKPCPSIGKIPHRMSKEDIREARDLFVAAGQRVEKAEFDFLEVQCGHGHLVAQFLSPAVNDRTDEYGGSLENRMRFCLELVSQIKNALSIPIIVRLSGAEMFPSGFTIEEMVTMSHALKDIGVAALHVSSGSLCETPPWYFQYMAVPKGKTWEFARTIKERVNIPVIAVGQVNTVEDAEQILSTKMADAVAVGRPLVADPEFIGKILGKVSDPVRPCAACLEGCVGGIKGGKGLMCVVNPRLGREKTEAPLRQAEPVKKVAVVGGGLAGMEAALTLKERGHHVTVFEQDELGGQFNLASLGPRKAKFKRITDYYTRRVQDEVKVIFKKALPDDLKANFDVVILATGSKPAIPQIPGLNGHFWAEILKPEIMPKGQTIVVIGGGLIGMEVADALAQNENKVTIVKKSEEMGKDMFLMAKNLTLKSLKESGVTVLTETQVLRKQGNTLYIRGPGGEATIENVDAIVIAKGMTPEASLEKELTGSVELYKIGDCLTVGKALDAIHSAFECAQNI
jgi:2,4-dienoyl-CoA reductase-like NADH-dependent reductase (Old Yellow Enzyme family)/thioredoxin reductase